MIKIIREAKGLLEMNKYKNIREMIK